MHANLSVYLGIVLMTVGVVLMVIGMFRRSQTPGQPIESRKDDVDALARQNAAASNVAAIVLPAATPWTAVGEESAVEREPHTAAHNEDVPAEPEKACDNGSATIVIAGVASPHSSPVEDERFFLPGPGLYITEPTLVPDQDELGLYTEDDDTETVEDDDVTET